MLAAATGRGMMLRTATGAMSVFVAMLALVLAAARAVTVTRATTVLVRAALAFFYKKINLVYLTSIFLV